MSSTQVNSPNEERNFSIFSSMMPQGDIHEQQASSVTPACGAGAEAKTCSGNQAQV